MAAITFCLSQYTNTAVLGTFLLAFSFHLTRLWSMGIIGCTCIQPGWISSPRVSFDLPLAECTTTVILCGPLCTHGLSVLHVCHGREDRRGTNLLLGRDILLIGASPGGTCLLLCPDVSPGTQSSCEAAVSVTSLQAVTSCFLGHRGLHPLQPQTAAP